VFSQVLILHPQHLQRTRNHIIRLLVNHLPAWPA
jgi:hypothetical protein